MMNVQSGIVNIRGREYQTVALRVQKFREEHPEHSLLTSVIDRTDESVVMLAQITDAAGRVLATGHAEEFRKASQINRTSALENAETSAIGRALAAFGLGGTEFATANEVENAIHQQGSARGQSKEAQSASGGPATDTTKGWREPDSPLSTPTKLHRELARLERELAGCGDSDMVYGLTATNEWREFVKIAEKHSPHYLRGGDPAPPEFKGLLNLAEQMVGEFDSETAQQMVDIARA